MPYLCPSLATKNPAASSMYLEAFIEYNTESNLIAISLVQSLSGRVIFSDAEAPDNGPPSSMASISEKKSECLASTCEWQHGAVIKLEHNVTALVQAFRS